VRHPLEHETPITVKEARKLLGKDSESLSDAQISEIILTLQMIARDYLHKSGSNISHGVY
jgi:hypothetical protein